MDKPLKETPSQTAGPYVHIGLLPQRCGVTTPLQLGTPSLQNGEAIKIKGVVWDGDGEPVKDVLIEIWQADCDGQFPQEGHANWQRVAGDFDTGEWVIETIKPGRVGNAAPHLTLLIVARGINIGLHSRIYFSDEANEDDPVLKGLSPSDRATLIADPDTNDSATYSFNIHLQGGSETVFFDV